MIWAIVDPFLGRFKKLYKIPPKRYISPRFLRPGFKKLWYRILHSSKYTNLLNYIYHEVFCGLKVWGEEAGLGEIVGGEGTWGNSNSQIRSDRLLIESWTRFSVLGYNNGNEGTVLRKKKLTILNRSLT